MNWRASPDILNKAANWFRLQRRLADYFSQQSELPEIAKAPSISIARDPGSGGRPIAEALSERLGYKFYDEALIDDIAKSAKKRKEVIQRIDERTRSTIEDFVHGVLNPDYVSDVTYVQHLVRCTLAIGHEGKAVVLGRGANFIMAAGSTLNVLVTAPYRVRVERAIEYENISQDEARDRIKKITAERKDFVSEYFGKDYNNSNYYDLILNTQYFTIEQSVDLIALAFRRKFAR